MKLNRTNTIIGWGVIAASLAVFFRRVWLMELDSFEFDDAFMFIRYADNILSGDGYTWNPGDPAIFGVTSILYTYIVAGVKLVFGSLLSNSWILVGTALFFAAAFLGELQGGLFQTVRSSQLKSRLNILLLTVPFLTLPLIFGFHVGTGMETTLSLFLHAGFIFSVIRYGNEDKGDWRWAALAGVTAYLIYLARPDNALAALLFPIGYLLATGKQGHLPRMILIAGGLLAADTIIKYLAFGDILPLSYYTKKSGFTEGYTAKYFWNPVKYLTQFTAYMMPYILGLFIFSKRKHVLLIASFLLPVLGTFIYYFTFDQIMGFNARLYFPFIPYIIIPAILVLDSYFLDKPEERQELWKPNFIFRKFMFLILFLFLTVYSKYRFINMYEAYAIREGNRNAISIPDLDARKYNREVSIRRISDLMKEFPDDFVFAATEHGFISGDNPGKRIMDLSGLHNVVIAKDGYSDDLLQAEHPDLIWMPHQDLTVLHHQVRTGDYFKENYEYVTGVYAFGIALRKDSQYYIQLREKMELD